MFNDSAIKVLGGMFQREGYPLYEVGGSVRDSILCRANNDIDLTTNARPNDIKYVLEVNGYPTYDIGIEYGTVGTTLVSGTKVEITTFRKEVYASDSRKPKVTFGDNLFDDLSRRDFTINAIARDAVTGIVFDPFNGMADLRDRYIRCVGSNKRFNEDPLRMMRAIRFMCQLDFTLKDIDMPNPERLNIISKERIQQELVKILETNKAAVGISILGYHKLTPYILPELTDLYNLDQGRHHIKNAFEHTIGVLDNVARLNFGEDNIVLRLSALLHDIGKPATKTVDGDDVHFYEHQHVGATMVKEVLKRLAFPNDIIDRVCLLVDMHMTPLMVADSKPTKKALRRIVRKAKGDIDLLMHLCIADTTSNTGRSLAELSKMYIEIKELLTEEEPLKLCSPINGGEIMSKFDLPAGPIIGELKNHLTELVIDGKLDKDDKESAYNFARNYMENTLDIFVLSDVE